MQFFMGNLNATQNFFFNDMHFKISSVSFRHYVQAPMCLSEILYLYALNIDQIVSNLYILNYGSN